MNSSARPSTVPIPTKRSPDLTRRHWQVLNVLDYGPASIAEADERVRALLPADVPSTTTPVVDQPVNDAGASRYADLLSEVSHFRRSIIAGISDEDNATTIHVL
jgi:hypothetical protein